MGSGAVGCAFGAKLENNKNNNVFFIARGLHLEALKSNGLTIHTNNEKLTLKDAIWDLRKNALPGKEKNKSNLDKFDFSIYAGSLSGIFRKKLSDFNYNNGID